MRNDGSVLNLDLFTAQDSMTQPVKTVNIFASVHSISKLLLGCTHGGFPVVKSLGENLENTFCGEITRFRDDNGIGLRFAYDPTFGLDWLGVDQSEV